MNSEQTNEIAAALAKAQGQMENAKFNKINPHFKSKYADLASIIDAIRKPLADNGLSYTQTTSYEYEYVEGRTNFFMLTTKLMHTSGQWISSDYPLPYAPDKPQVMGSAQTYARRYSLASLCGIAAEEDDDANVAQPRKPPQPAQDIIRGVEGLHGPAINPPHDPQTGEVIDEGTGAIPIEEMAREAASRGRAVFYAWYKNRTGAEKNRLHPIIDELKEIVEAVEAAEQGEGS